MIFVPVDQQHSFARFQNNFQAFQLPGENLTQSPLAFETALPAAAFTLPTRGNLIETVSALVGTVGLSLGLNLTGVTNTLTNSINHSVVDAIDDWVIAASVPTDTAFDFTTILTGLNPSGENLVSLSLFGTNSFNATPTAKSYFVTHGYHSSSDADWVSNMANTIRGFDAQVNVILVDWEEAASPGFLGLNYYQAAENTFDVGQQLAEMMRDMPINPGNVQLIGHSLGAHVTGVAGDYYRDLTGQDIDTIVGLDPAGPAFEGSDYLNSYAARPPAERLDATDAERVIAYHTSEVLGYENRLGDLDLYINPDDVLQPGQSTFSGNHSYSHTLYTQLIAGQTFSQPDGSAFGYSDQFGLTGSVNVETVV